MIHCFIIQVAGINKHHLLPDMDAAAAATYGGMQGSHGAGDTSSPGHYRVGLIKYPAQVIVIPSGERTENVPSEGRCSVRGT